MEIVGLFPPWFAQPLVKAIGWNRTAALFEGGPESGFRGYGFHPGIDHPGADGDILGPKRHQPPVAFLDVSFALVLDDDGYLLSRGHVVVVGTDLERGRMSIKEALKLT